MRFHVSGVVAARDLELMGGAPFRDRFTDGVWQGPTWSFAILLFALDLGKAPDGAGRFLLVAGFTVVMVVTMVAVLVRWQRLPVWTQALLPAGDLIGACLMVGAYPDGASTTILLCSLPVVWLAFEFGWWGVVVGVTMATVSGIAPEASHLVGIRSSAGSANIVVPILFVIGLAVVSRLMSGLLVRTGETLRAQAADLGDALALAEARLVIMTGVMESIPAGVTVVQEGSEPLENERAAAMTLRAGVASGAPGAGGSWVFSADGTSAVAPHDQMLARARAGEEFTGVTYWIGEPGSQVAVIASARRLVRPNGERLGMVLAAWDVTELMDAIRVREDFLTTVSHELRTPLAAVMASLELLAELLESGGFAADAPWLVASSARNAGLLNARIAQLLASSESVDVPFEPRVCDVGELVRVALTKHEPALVAADISLATEVQPGLWAEVDPGQFEQVVYNLVTNSVKYTPAAGIVRVSLRAGADGFVLSVADNGMGMTPDELRQVYDRFYRADGAKTRAIQGLGIGLGLVRSIVDRHGGVIELTSKPGAGTTATVSMPSISPTGVSSPPRAGRVGPLRLPQPT